MVSGFCVTFHPVAMPFKFIVLSLLWLAIESPQISALVEFTNIKCDPLDTSFAAFEYCRIKAVNRSYKYISLKVNLFKVPVTKVKVNIATMKRYNGYHPFLYNITFDGCKHLVYPERNPIVKYLVELFAPYSNINHTCPYTNDVIVDKLPVSYVNNQVTNVLPLPHGDYAFYSSWMAYDINRANVKVYMTLK